VPRFLIPLMAALFEIPDEWWSFAEMGGFAPSGGGYYAPPPTSDFEVVAVEAVEPPMRNGGVPPFKKYKLVPVLFAFRSPECALPPIEVFSASEGPYRFKVRNGYHRYYASIAAGFTKLPVAVCSPPYDFGRGGN
jgi:hypothetical protein